MLAFEIGYLDIFVIFTNLNLITASVICLRMVDVEDTVLFAKSVDKNSVLTIGIILMIVVP